MIGHFTNWKDYYYDYFSLFVQKYVLSNNLAQIFFERSEVEMNFVYCFSLNLVSVSGKNHQEACHHHHHLQANPQGSNKG